MTQRRPRRLKRLPPPAQNQLTDSVEDPRTQEQRDFDNALKKASDRLATAKADASAAAGNAAATGADKAAVQTQIDMARMALGDAVMAARELLAARPLDANGNFDVARIGQAANFADEAANEKELAETLLSKAEANTGWSGQALVAVTVFPLGPPFGEGKVVRRERLDSDGNDAPTLLTAAKIAPVVYEDGKILIANGKGSSGDRLRMRGLPVPFIDADGKFSYQDFTDFEAGGGAPPQTKTVAGLTVTPTGIVVDIGGKNIQGLDFFYFNVLNSPHDLALTFEKPSVSPEGNAEHYWTAALTPTRADVAAYSALEDGGQIPALGTYYVRLSNHIGLDANLEPSNPNLPAHTEDDENYYLSYAAYGFMDFASSRFDDYSVAFDRAFPFHVGYDAFKNEARKKTTDIATAHKITNGKFKGRTIAVQLLIHGFQTTMNLVLPGTRRILPVVDSRGCNAGCGTGARLRGDIELTATISGTASNNTISGKIKNLESFDAKGYWEDFAAIPGEVGLASGVVTASGSFSGATGTVPGFGTGGYEGSFYGPHGSLEAAGVWYLHPDASLAAHTHNPILGSFGAALVREDGTYGTVVPGGG